MDATDYILAGTPDREIAVAQDAATRESRVPPGSIYSKKDTDIAQELELKNIKISQVVYSMKEFIIGDDLIQQAKALEYLASVLGKLDRSFLPRQDVSLVVNYLAARIETAHVAGVKETALGLQALATMHHFDAIDVPEVCRKVFLSSVYFKENSAPARLEVYRLIERLLNVQTLMIVNMEGEFIRGILSLVEVEKDPRCLLRYFSILPIFLAKWEPAERDVRGEVRDLWDSISRYYPITFRAKPDDPIGITPDDLKLCLRECMSATSKFAPLAFPFLIEKLDYQVTANVKRDVLQTLRACIEYYDLPTVATWSSQVWDALKFEVLNATEDDLADEALQTLKIIAEQLSYDGLTLQTLERTPLFHFVDLVTKECVKHLREPQQRYAQQSGQIIGKVASGSPFSFHLIIKAVLPELMKIIHETNAILKKRELLEVIIKILNARLDLVQGQEASEFPVFGILDAVSESCAVGTIGYGGLTFFRDILFETFALSLTRTPAQEASMRLTAIKGLSKLVKLPGFLTSDEVGMVIQHFNALILDEFDAGHDLREEAILALQEIAKLHERVVVDISFPAFMALLPDVIPDDKDVESWTSILEAFAKVGCEGFAFQTLSVRLVHKLDDVLKKNVSQAYAHLILATMLFAVREREQITKARIVNNLNNEFDVIDDPNSASVALVKCLYKFVTSLHSSNDAQYQEELCTGLGRIQMAGGLVFPDDTFLVLIGKICNVVVRGMTVDNQLWAAQNAFTLFKEPLSHQIDLQSVTQLQNRTMVLSMYLIAGLHGKMGLGVNPQSICSMLIRNVVDCGELIKDPHEAVDGVIALLFNKWIVPTDPDLASMTEIEPQELILSALKELDSKTDVQALNILRMSLIFTHAANLKGARRTAELLSVLVKLLNNKKHGSTLALNFGRVLGPSKLLNKENHAIIRGLYKQRPYAICVHQIIDQFKASNDADIKSYHLAALSGILKHTPTEVVLPEIDVLLPLILQSMEASDFNIKIASIEILGTAIAETPSSVERYIVSLLKRLYDRIRDTTDASTTVRVMALKCLKLVPRHLSSAIALRYKMEVLKELEFALHDRTRSVREEAVRTRYSWFGLAEKFDGSD